MPRRGFIGGRSEHPGPLRAKSLDLQAPDSQGGGQAQARRGGAASVRRAAEKRIKLVVAKMDAPSTLDGTPRADEGGAGELEPFGESRAQKQFQEWFHNVITNRFRSLPPRGSMHFE
ncbi:hypothetical protein CYMTET_45524 [Cymbomonas tetramitiformis]|uniref:Uncharacterized protein n=1 Tax=Cymbomonas tetramitiformis TaxID=36881 RepID=A0AAE0C046_9CHLO|nr:hypothetical protein CYMTET_45524 [Cymbomonas tetramitiformis]